MLPLTINVRLIPAVYTQVTVELKKGPSAAQIGIASATICHPTLRDETGDISDACRSYIVEQVRAACARDGRQRTINWPNDRSEVPVT